MESAPTTCEEVLVPKNVYNNTVWIESWNTRPSLQWLHDEVFCTNILLCFPIVAFYLLAVLWIKEFMKFREAFDLRRPLLAWNIFLASFSTIGAVRMFPEWFSILFVEKHGGLVASVCDTRYVTGAAGFWVVLFCWSKILEFGDTLFVLLRKQKLIFLHWYHHAATMIFCWLSLSLVSGFNRWFAIMNLTVHALMYTYYALKSLRVPVPRLACMVLTALQLSQMFAGTGLVLLAWKAKSENPNGCFVFYELIYAALLMYFSYVLLFAHFFYKSYMGKAAKKVVKNSVDINENKKKI